MSEQGEQVGQVGDGASGQVRASESKWIKGKSEKGNFFLNNISSERADKEKILLNRKSAGIVQFM